MNLKSFQTLSVNKCDDLLFSHLEDSMTLCESRDMCMTIICSDYVLNMICDISFVLHPSDCIEVVTGDKRRFNVGSTSEAIILPKGCRNVVSVCHEVSHALTIDDMDDPSVAFHGSEFCYVYINLLRKFAGDDFAQDLMNAYDYHGVDFNPLIL